MLLEDEKTKEDNNNKKYTHTIGTAPIPMSIYLT
jgi:hypothetical protein